jgi:ElaB/YqjD/DUF883 family membrane-anchored ribosome-binding protein
MAEIPDLATNRAGKAGAASSAPTPLSREDQLEEQISRLQDDLKAVTATLARLSSEKVAEARQSAKSEYRQLVQSGQNVIDDVSDQAGALEKQIKDTIREKPLTAVAGAIGIGFLLALLSRR